VLDADKIAKQILAPNSPALAEVSRSFGADVLLPNGELNRQRMREIIFSDPSARKRLEAIVHPRVAQAIHEALAASKARIIVVEVPLLFEAGWDKCFDKTIVVWVPTQVQIERLVQRDNIPPSLAEAMIKAQMPLDEKRARAHFIVDNSASLEHTRRQVESLWAALKRLA